MSFIRREHFGALEALKIKAQEATCSYGNTVYLNQRVETDFKFSAADDCKVIKLDNGIISSGRGHVPGSLHANAN